MQPPLGTKRDLRRPLLPCAIVAGALAVLAALVGPPGASGQDYTLPKQMSPFPVVRIVGNVGRTSTEVTRLSIRGRVGVGVITRCAPRRKCPYTKRVRLIPGPQGRTRTIRIRALERRFKPGVTLRVIIAQPTVIGKYTSFLTRRRKQPRRYDRCVMGTNLTPIRCPAS